MSKNHVSRWLMAALALVVIALLVGSIWFYRVQEQSLRREAEKGLATIARLKTDQIVQWRAEQLTDAAVITESPFFAEAAARWLEAPQAEDADLILAHFRSLQEHYHYYDVLLTDVQGQVRLSLSDYVGPLHDDAAQTLAAALTEQRPVLADLHVGPGDQPPHIGAVAPLFARDPETSEPLGAVFLQSDARQFLYPLIQSWPTPNQSAETLLVRRDGDEALFLNDLRFQPGAAFTLRFPLTQTDLPAVMAVLGQEGIVRGVDYRGVEVLAALQAVPDSPWFMVAKVDKAEAFSVLRRELALILALILGLSLFATGGLVVLWQRDAIARYRTLYRAEQRYGVTLMSVGDGVIATDAEGRVELLNPVAEALTGWPEEKARGKPLDEVFRIVNEETRQPVENPAQRVLREESIVGLANHTLLVARDGTERPIADSGAPIRDEKGEISGVVLVFRDQTEERAAQKALRESEEKYRLLAETTRDIILLHDMEGRVVYVNQAGLDFAGFEQSEAIGQPITAFIPAEHLAGVVERQERRAAGNSQPYAYQTEFVNRAGERIPVEVSSTPVLREGQVSDVLVVARDITERLRAKEERERLMAQLYEQARRMEKILDTVPAGVLLLDAEGRILQTNPVAKGELAILAGTMEDDILTHLGGRPLAELLTSPPTRGLWHKIEVEKHTFEAIARPVENGPEPEQWVLVINNVTREQEIQAQLQRQEQLAAVGQLAAGIAHDFNNIMAVIVLYTQMGLRNPELPAKLRERLQTVFQQAKRATDLVQQILDFSRRAMLERRLLDLEPFTKEMAKLLERTLPESIEIELRYGAHEYTVHADPTRMQQMMMNLALNARDAMPDGGKLLIELERIHISDRKQAPLPEMETGEWVRMRVTDSGTGIPPEALPHIFEPFFTTKEPGKGSGLGLAQVYGIVGQHGGRIDIETQVGEGTTFIIYLPAMGGQPSESPLEVVVIPRGRGRVVLVVEDGAAVREALVESLKQWDYCVLEAANGQEALAVMEEQGEQVALVVSDVVMPGMGGIPLFHALRQRGWEIPVILLTGHVMDKEMEALRGQGLAAWLTKPIRLERLAQAVVQAMEGTT